MALGRCPDCSRIISSRFVVHYCVPVGGTKKKKKKKKPVTKKKLPKVGDIVTLRKLRSLYDKCDHIPTVLRQSLEPAARKRRQVKRWRVRKALPTSALYRSLRSDYYTLMLGDLVSEAYSEAEAIGDELGDWYENLPEPFQMGDKGERLEEARSAIEEVVSAQPEVPEDYAQNKVVFIPTAKDTRVARIGDAAARLDMAADELQTALEELREAKPDEGHDDLEEVISTLEAARDDLNDLDIPGMFD